jgi:hypothetical protein
MLELTIEIIKNDLRGSKKEIFLAEFPELNDEAQQIIKKPNCPSCVKGYFEKMFKIPKFKERLKLIYGNDIKVDQKIEAVNQGVQVKKNEMSIIQEVFDVPLDEWEEWFKNNSMTTKDRQVRMMTTFYNPHKDCVTVSLNSLKKQV